MLLFPRNIILIPLAIFVACISGCSARRQQATLENEPKPIPISRKPLRINISNIKPIFKAAETLATKSKYETESDYRNRVSSSWNEHGTLYFIIPNKGVTLSKTFFDPRVEVSYSPESRIITVSTRAKTLYGFDSSKKFDSDRYGNGAEATSPYENRNGQTRYPCISIDQDDDFYGGFGIKNSFGASVSFDRYKTYMIQLTNQPESMVERDVKIDLIATEKEAEDLIETNSLEMVVGVKIGDIKDGFINSTYLSPTLRRPSSVSYDYLVLPGTLREVMAIDSRTNEVLATHVPSEELL